MKWQPIETAPKDETRVWLYGGIEGPRLVNKGFFSRVDGCWYMCGVGHLNGMWEPSHWILAGEDTEDT